MYSFHCIAYQDNENDVNVTEFVHEKYSPPANGMIGGFSHHAALWTTRRCCIHDESEYTK
jgi:hypothetical protein